MLGHRGGCWGVAGSLWGFGGRSRRGCGTARGGGGGFPRLLLQQRHLQGCLQILVHIYIIGWWCCGALLLGRGLGGLSGLGCGGWVLVSIHLSAGCGCLDTHVGFWEDRGL